MVAKQAGQDAGKKSVAFEKARFEYCAKLYEREAARKETLEKKSQFLLSLVTLFLGAVFLKLDFLNTLHELLLQKNVPTPLSFSINISLILLALALLVAMLGVLGSMRLQVSRTNTPPTCSLPCLRPTRSISKGTTNLTSTKRRP